MSSVRITATGDEALSVEVLLGDNSRGWHNIAAGESKDLSVGANQTLSVDVATSPKVAVKRQEQGLQVDPFITPEGAEPKPWITGDDGADVPVGVDVQAEDEGREAPAEVSAKAEDGRVGAAIEEAEPLEDAKDYEAQSIGAGEVGDIGALFGGTEDPEAESKDSVVSTLEADSPLEVGSLSDLPSPFDTDAESADGDAEEAEDTGDEEAQA
ncbi:hypothetical protein LCGC14_1303320 [marine sediment metagenome]|uniref:Uncharacterized protein n=1 Tax=marine sediment metagenome TaxID=412755 RepID=A0A0F9KPD3_9ZZZZ